MKRDFNEVYDLYALLLYRITYTYLKNKEDSENAVQDVFLKWFHHLSFQSQEHEKAWLIVCCKNNLKNGGNKKYK